MNQPLFELGNFTLHAGGTAAWKIECDALSDDDWKCLARMIAERVPQFSSVRGIPRGGLKLAEYLVPYVTTGPALVVDDVWTTGTSMREELKPGEIGFVVFARNKIVESNIKALFTMSS